MNTDDNGQQPITDDAELAKVLEGMNGPAPVMDTGHVASGLQFEETPIVASEPVPIADPIDTADDDLTVEETELEPTLPPVEEPALPSYEEPTAVPALSPTATTELDSIKKDALEELRPLVDRLNLPADEKFDTLLLIIRSTDDQSLIGAAHAVAKTIEDETRRAQALLDVIKEIDFFASQAN